MLLCGVVKVPLVFGYFLLDCGVFWAGAGDGLHLGDGLFPVVDDFLPLGVGFAIWVSWAAAIAFLTARGNVSGLGVGLVCWIAEGGVVCVPCCVHLPRIASPRRRGRMRMLGTRVFMVRCDVLRSGVLLRVLAGVLG